MDQLKKHLFWIILGVVVLGAVIAWFSLEPEVDAAKAIAVAPVKPLAQIASEPAKIKTEAHDKAAKEYVKKLEAERTALTDTIAKWPNMSEAELNKRYKDAPTAAEAIKFDEWMDVQRKRIRAKLEGASVQVYPRFEQDLFLGVNVDAAPNKDVRRHRDYQLRVLNIVDEIAEALAAKTGSEKIWTFETDPTKPEAESTTQVGPLRFDGFTYHLPEETAELEKKAYLKALDKGGNYKPPTDPNAKGFTGLEMPVSVSTVDIEYVGHVSSLPVVIKRLEASDKYYAEVSRADFERAVPPFPGPSTDTKIQQDYAKAEYKPMLNTHYGEGPIRALITLKFYEFDKVKAEKLTAPPPPPAPATRPAGTPNRGTTH